MNTPVEIVYEPVKIGIRDQKIFLEVHPDIYKRISDLRSQTFRRLDELGWLSSVSVSAVNNALDKQTGVPVCVGVLKKGGDVAFTGRASAFQ